MPNKTVKDLVEYFYMCHQPALKKKQIEKKWTSKDKALFESECRKLNETLNEAENSDENKIKHLRKFFPNKTAKKITQYYHICYLPGSRKKHIENEKIPRNKRIRKPPPSKERSDTKRIRKETG